LLLFVLRFENLIQKETQTYITDYVSW